MTTVCAIIPARGGSKGLPRKNVLPLAGKPLIAHTIEAARAARAVGRVIVSTDDAEIRDIAVRYGAEVVLRPPELAGDTASSESAILHVLEHLKLTEGVVPDLLAFLQCTSPLTLPEDIDGTVDRLLADSADSVLAVAPFHGFLWQQHADEAVPVNHDKRVRLLRQQCPSQYRETGAVYVMRTAGFLTAKHRFFGKTSMHVIPADRGHEIDDAADFELARILLQWRKDAS